MSVDFSFNANENGYDPQAIGCESTMRRAARILAERQKQIDELSCMCGTPVYHSAAEAAGSLPFLLSPYSTYYEPIVGIDRLFSEYLQAQAKHYMLRLSGMALAKRIEIAEKAVQERLRKKFAGEYEISDKPIPSEQVDLIIVRQQLGLFQAHLDYAKEQEDQAKAKFDAAMARCSKRIAEQRITISRPLSSFE